MEWRKIPTAAVVRSLERLVARREAVKGLAGNRTLRRRMMKQLGASRLDFPE